MVVWPSGQKSHFFRGGCPGAGSNLGVAISIFFSFIVFLDFYRLAFYCLFSPLILLASRVFCENLFLVKQLTGQRTASKSITSPRWVDTWARDMVMGYWSVAILFWQLSIDHIVNVQFTKTRLRHPSLPFDSLPYPTRTICRRVRTYVRSVNHVTTKRKEVDYILWVWGSSF